MAIPRSIHVCWQCQWRLAAQRRILAQRASRKNGIARRAFHATQSVCGTNAITYSNKLILRNQVTETAFAAAVSSPEQPFPAQLPRELPIREHLSQWSANLPQQDQIPQPLHDIFKSHFSPEDTRNILTTTAATRRAADESDGDLEQFETTEDRDDELITIGLFMKPGDVAELAAPGHEPILAVYVRQMGVKAQFLSVNGRWSHYNQGQVTFAIPGCIDPTLLEPLIPFMPNSIEELEDGTAQALPQEVVQPIQTLLLRLTRESERIYRTNAPILDMAYSALADSSRTRMMTVAQIAKALLASDDPSWIPSPPALLAVRKALSHNLFRFYSDKRSQRLTNVFAIRPKDEVKVLETVHEWIRKHRHYTAKLVNSSSRDAPNLPKEAQYIADFLVKARRLVAKSQAHRYRHWTGQGPSRTNKSNSGSSSSLQAVWGEEFNSYDRQIIKFLLAWAVTLQFRAMPDLHSACTYILHALGCYDFSSDPALHKIRNASTCHLFLQEIGVITPFENRALYDESLMLPTVRQSRNLEVLARKAELARNKPDFRDTMSGIRRDWGSIPVYCIDSSDAKEIDDGISIERVPGRPSEYWIHAHIANPTAFFDKKHILAGLAAHMTSTLYTPTSTFPMLPSWVTQDYFSLAPNRPVITFSSRIDGLGNILESNISHGIIRQVISITPEELAKYLDEALTKETVSLVVGSGAPTMREPRPLPQITSDQLQNLRDLYSAARALWAGRKAAGGVKQDLYNPVSVRVFGKLHEGGLPWMPPSMEKARFVHGDPIIEVTSKISGRDKLSSTVNSGNIVEEIMLLAGRTAGAWCAERNIPVTFRGTIETPLQEMSRKEFQEQVLWPYIEKHDSISKGILYRYSAVLGRAILHSSSISHTTLGVQSYVKVTSPLRRFSDMMAHWQIEAASRHEARTGRKFYSMPSGSSKHSHLPFSHRQVQEAIVTLSPREKLIMRTQRATDQMWISQAFMRAFYYKEAPLPDTFTAWVSFVEGVHEQEAVMVLDPYHVSVKVDNGAHGKSFKIGDKWQVRLRHVDLYNRLIYVEPIRLLHRDEIL